LGRERSRRLGVNRPLRLRSPSPRDGGSLGVPGYSQRSTMRVVAPDRRCGAIPIRRKERIVEPPGLGAVVEPVGGVGAGLPAAPASRAHAAIVARLSGRAPPLPPVAGCGRCPRAAPQGVCGSSPRPPALTSGCANQREYHDQLPQRRADASGDGIIPPSGPLAIRLRNQRACHRPPGRGAPYPA